jgi:branched-chain amino acid transport system permease protein
VFESEGVERDYPRLPGFVILVLLAVLPWITHSEFLLESSFLAGLTAIEAYGLQIAYKYCGIFSMFYVASAGIGAYAVVVLALSDNFPFWAGLLVAIGASLVVGLIIGAVSVRCGGMYFVMVTFGLAGALGIVADNLNVTGGTNGLTVVEPMNMGLFTIQGASETASYLAMFVLVLLSIAFLVIPRETRLGKRLVAGRDNIQLARSVGIRAHQQRVAMFALSAIPTVLAGALFAFHEYHVEPDQWGSTQALLVFVVLILGGLNSWAGPLIGAAIVTFLPNYLNLNPTLSQMAYGVLLIAMIILAPEGAGGWLSKLTSATIRTAARVARSSGRATRAAAPAGSPEAVDQAAGSRRRVSISAVSKRARSEDK